MLILHHILKPRRICDIYDLFVPFINLLTYLLLTYMSRIILSARDAS